MFITIAALLSTIAVPGTLTLCEAPIAEPSSRSCRVVSGDTIALTSGDARIRVTLAETDGRRVAGVKLSVQGSSHMWEVEDANPHATRRLTLLLPPGEYKLAVSASHYRTATQVQATGKDVTLFLQRHPVISGAVRSGVGSPLANAAVRDVDGHYAAQTDDAGAFSIEASELWPRRLEVSYPGLASKLVGIPDMETDVALPAVTLTSGSTLGVDVRCNVEGCVDVSVQLLRDEGVSPLPLATKRLAELPARATFSDLDRGEYYLLLRGKEPLQRFGVPIRLENDGVAELHEVTLEPLLLTIRVRRKKEPVANASIEVQPVGDGASGWRDTVSTSDDGTVTTELWQRGEYLFAARASGQAVPIGVVATVSGDREAEVEIDLPETRIGGSVVDENEKPVANAQITIETESDDGMQSMFRAGSDAAGKFSFESIPTGIHRLSAEAPGFFRSSPLEVRLSPNDERREIELMLQRSTSIPVRIVSSRSTPLTGAAILVSAAGAVQQVVRSDDSGRADVPVAGTTATMLYIFPREGSFAIARIADDSSSERRIVVPEGSASLHLRTTNESGQPVPGVRFVLRYNGELIPAAVSSWAEQHAGVPMRTDERGEAFLPRLPPGTAELWPLRADSEIDAILRANDSPAPAQISLQPGQNVATMVFRKK